MIEECPPDKRKYISNHTLQLELRSMRSDFKLWLVGAVVGNQVLANFTLPGSVTTVGGILILLGVAGKALLFR